MDQDHIMQLLRMTAWVISFFIFSCWGGCATNKWLALKEKETLIGKLDDVVAQRLFAVSYSIDSVDFGNTSAALQQEGQARGMILQAIVKGSTIPEAKEEAGVESEPVALTNQAVAAVQELAEE